MFTYLKCSYDNFRRVIGHVHHIFSFYKLDKVNYEDVKSPVTCVLGCASNCFQRPNSDIRR